MLRDASSTAVLGGAPLIGIPHDTSANGAVAAAIAPVVDQGRIIGAVRLDYRLAVIEEEIADLSRNLGLGLLVAGAACAAFAGVLASSLAAPMQRLAEAARAVARGDLSRRARLRGRDEVAQAGAAFDSLAESLEALEFSRREVMSEVSHDLHGLATGLSAAAEALQRGALDDAELAPLLLQGIAARTRQISRLADDLLQTTRLETGRLVLETQLASPAALIEQTAAEFALQAAERGVTIHIQTEDPPALAQLDAVRLLQALANLVENALRHTPPGGTITLGAQIEQGWLHLSVGDSGSGVPSDEAARMFTRFYRPSGGRPGRLGLGLGIVRGIAEAHGGRVEVASGLGAGAIFTLLIPVATVAPALPAETAPARQHYLIAPITEGQPMIQVSQPRKAFGTNDLLDEISFHISPRDRVGLVAVNGAGKTTLMRILASELPPDGGSVTVTKGATVGYLPQDSGCEPGNTVRQELISGRAELTALEAELAAAEYELESTAPDDPALGEIIARYGLLHDRFDDLRGHDVETEIGIVMHGLGFAQDDVHRPVETFSGGWQMRIALGRLLLQRPDLLLLDEPTNHLDVAAVEWLEDYLRGYPGALLIVSHDRTILDRVTNRTLELSRGQLDEYAGGYSAYVEEKARRAAVQAKAFEQQQQLIQRTQEWIDRFGAKSSKATQAKSREKFLERMDRIEAPDGYDKRIALRFDAAGRSGRTVLEAMNLTRRFDKLTVLNKVNLSVERGERVALVGPNGAGKSTLIRLLAGVDAPDEGEVRRGHNVLAAYFAQRQAETLDPELTVLEQIAGAGETSVGELRGLLGRFLFTGDDVFKRVGMLSGGERSRLAFAKMLLAPSNVLLLDEPTNHLDIPSKEALEQALLSYEGAIVLVSHDRYLIDRIATRVIAVGDGGLEIHLGNYTQYRERLAAREREAAVAAAQAAAAEARAAKRAPSRAPGEAAAVRRKVRELETEIARMEAQTAELAERLADPALYLDHQKAQAVAARHERRTRQLEKLMAEWEAVAAQVM
ncbi:MAG: ATP-binding cassette domain-containing protein [Chloroflexi bacterium]|nr:ATP-binding cassette domain-containing protein [Chloroflexota bacterium]